MLHSHRGAVFGACAVTAAARQLLASAGDDGTVRVWNPATGQTQALIGVERPFSSACRFTTKPQSTA